MKLYHKVNKTARTGNKNSFEAGLCGVLGADLDSAIYIKAGQGAVLI